MRSASSWMPSKSQRGFKSARSCLSGNLGEFDPANSFHTWDEKHGLD